MGKAFEVPKRSVYQAIRKPSLNDVDKAIASYHLLKKDCRNEYNFDSPADVNRLGYELLRLGKIGESIKVFKLATTEFPKDANVFDSLGEAYYTDKQYDLALKSYKQAISLGGTAGNAEKMISKILKEAGL